MNARAAVRQGGLDGADFRAGAVPGCDQANREAVQLAYFTSDQPELVGQYAAAFEKVWANRKSLA